MTSSEVASHEADAASLRRAFNAFAEDYNAGNCGPMSSVQRAVWAKLYVAVRDHTAGLAILGELQRAKERDELRRLELADTDATLASMMERYRELREKLEQWQVEHGELRESA